MHFETSGQKLNRLNKKQVLIVASYNNFASDEKSNGLNGFSGSNLDFNDSALNFYVEYGLSDSFSGYLSTGFGSGSDQDNDNAKGIEPVRLGLKYNLNLNEKTAFFAEVKLSIATEEIESDNRLNGSNNASLQLGVNKETSSGNFGALTDIGLYTSDSDDGDGFKGQLSGGIFVSIFKDWKIKENSLLGVALNYSNQTSNLGGNVSFGQFGLFTIDGEEANLIGPEVYGKASINEKFNIIGSVKYNEILDVESSSSNVSSFLDGRTFSFNIGVNYLL